MLVKPDGPGGSSAVSNASLPQPTPTVSAAGSGAAERPPLDEVQLQGSWWTWAASQLEADNPVSDTTGKNCAKGQPGGVWFLAGSFGGRVTRTCTVPAGTPLVFPLVNLIGASGDCDAFMATAKGSAVLDGDTVSPVSVAAKQIHFQSVDANPVTSTGGQHDAYACGLWVQLPPLTPGGHRLLIDGAAGTFTTHVDYRLTIS